MKTALHLKTVLIMATMLVSTAGTAAQSINTSSWRIAAGNVFAERVGGALRNTNKCTLPGLAFYPGKTAKMRGKKEIRWRKMR